MLLIILKIENLNLVQNIIKNKIITYISIIIKK